MRLQAKRLWITSTPGARRGSVVTAWSYRPRICPQGGRPGGTSTSSHPPDRPLLRKEDRTEDHDPVRTAGKTLIDLLVQAVAQGEDRLIVPDRDACGGEGFIERSRDRILVLRRVRQENVVCFLRVIAFRRRSRGEAREPASEAQPETRGRSRRLARSFRGAPSASAGRCSRVTKGTRTLSSGPGVYRRSRALVRRITVAGRSAA